MLGWKNYGNGHVIFDGGAGTSPTGAVINNTNAAIAWSATYPTLMGWNGTSTYGVRVDVARYSESCTGNAATATLATTATNATNATNATTAATATNANALQGYTIGAGGNGIVQRDASGYINGTYYNGTGTFPATAGANTTGMGTFTGTNGTDNYGRGYTAAAAATLLSGQTMNINGSSTSCSGNAATATQASNASVVNNTGGFTMGYSAASTAVGTVGALGPYVGFGQNSTYAAGFSLHRSGAYAINVGLDTDNVFRIGGWSDGASTYRIQSDTAGNFTARGNVSAYSDERLKTDWAPVATNFVDQLASIKSGSYTRIDNQERQVGVSAQSLQTLLPEAVMDDGAHLAVAYGNAAMVSAVELAKEVVALKAELASLKELVAALIAK
jgi:hypothetical protein